jgi:hypothetical protein
MDRRIRDRSGSRSMTGIIAALVLALVVGGLIYAFSGHSTNTAGRNDNGVVTSNQSSGASGGRTGNTVERSTTTGETTPNSPSSNNSTGSITPPNPSTQQGTAGGR